MIVLPFKIPKPEDNALVFQVDNDVVFYDKLHQHEEIQVSLIVEGKGTLVVGDTINSYIENDILVIGSQLPHVFKSDQESSSRSIMYTFFFSELSFGNHFFSLDELKEVVPFFKRSKHGFKINSNKKKLRKLFNELENASQLNRFVIFLKVLQICSTANYSSLSSFVYNKRYSDNEGKRIQNIFEYTMTNFQNPDITLNSVAEIANMTKNAFCKYFKKRTNKTYFQFLNELRIEKACKLLIYNKEFLMTEVAEQSGYNNLSNFNRQFKFIKNQSPSAFRKKN